MEPKKEYKGLTKKNKLIILISVMAVIIAVTLIVVIIIVIRRPKENTEPVNENFTFLVEGDSTPIKNDDIFSGQLGIEQEYLKEYKKGNYTIDNPYVVVDPFYLSPQTALVLFKTSKKEEVTVTIKGKHNDDITRTFEASTDHYLPIYGLYGNYENEVILKTASGKTKSLKIKIDKSADTGAVQVLENNVTNSNGEFYFATSSLGMATIAYDNYGEVRWWLNMGYTKGMTFLQNGHMLLSSANEGPDITSTSGVVEVDMMGFVYNEYELSGGYHHDAYEMASGNLIILTSKANSDYVADDVIELDRNTGKIIKEWNVREIVSKIDAKLIEEGEINWGWINSVTYDSLHDALILSLRNQNSVISLGYTSHEINWILGDPKYWSSKFDKYFIKGTGDNFIYPMGQHSVNITPEGYLSIFNNGYDSYKEKAVTCGSLKNNASYAMVYALDLDNRTASVVWSYGGKEYFSYALSSFTYAANNHRIFNSGWHFADGVDYNDTTCTQFSNDLYDAYVIDFDQDNNISVKMHIDESKFEMVKADIYNLSTVSVKPNNQSVISNYTVTEGRYLTTYPDEEYETLSEEEALKYATNEDCFITFYMYNKRFRLYGAIPDDMNLKVTFISPRGIAYRYTMKEKNKPMKDFINISNLPSGKYYVYVNMGDNVYNTTQYIEV